MNQETKKEGKKGARYRSSFSFGMQEFELMLQVRAVLHENMYQIRCGKIAYIRPAYASLKEYYISFIRPLLSPAERVKQDKIINDIFNLVCKPNKTPEEYNRIFHELEEFEENIMVYRQMLNLGIETQKLGAQLGTDFLLKDSERV